MKILLDESVPVQVRKALQNHQVFIVKEMGWSGLGNGDLLTAAERERFHILIVADKNLRYQQNLADRRLAILELWTNHRPTLEQHLTYISAAVERISPFEFLVLEKPESGK
jgi:hypothetical protein